MLQLRDGRRGFHESTLSGMPIHMSGRRAAGTWRLGAAVAPALGSLLISGLAKNASVKRAFFRRESGIALSAYHKAR